MKQAGTPILFGFTRYQWLVLFAAWLGWGFDIFDALLFNYVSRLCIPSLLHIPSLDAKITAYWTGVLTSVLLIGWATGGIIFGKITDRFGRTRTLMFTMLTYALATTVSAFSVNIWMLAICRFIASLGIGGEWAAGASLVAESVPEKKRVQAGALLYTAAPVGLFLATFVTDLFTRQFEFVARDPDLSWRIVFLTGLIPAGLALLIRWRVQEPEGWKPTVRQPKIAELFTPELRAKTIGGTCLAAVALISWWTCNAFIPLICSLLVDPATPNAAAVQATYVTAGTSAFNIGGLLGTLLTVPIALHLGRRPMFILYFLVSAVAIWCTFQLPLEPQVRIASIFFIGLSVFGIFGSFTFYLPELFPTHLRGTGSGFSYNVARYLTAFGPFLVASVARESGKILSTVSWVAVVPAIGVLLLLLGVGVETRSDSKAQGSLSL
jgi:MFS family permease